MRSVFGVAQKHGELLEVVTVAELCQEGTLRDHIDILYNVGSCPVSGAPSCEGQELSSPGCSDCAFSAADQVRAPDELRIKSQMTITTTHNSKKASRAKSIALDPVSGSSS